MMKKVLIVEDEKPIAHALELKLQHLGYDAHTVFNGEEALGLLEKDSFDLILLDLMMPTMDGFATLEELRKRGNTTPIIVSSNLGQKEDFARAQELGAKDFFIKSDTSMSEVVEKIKKYLN